MKVQEVTLIIPYYRAPLMLRKQLDTVKDYPSGYTVIVIDDCSLEPAKDVFTPNDKAKLYRIEDDKAWNREGARNLGSTISETDWIIHVDTDHVLPVDCAEKLLEINVNKRYWYRFPRFRVGKADETRRKDTIPEDQEYGQIKPHMDSYLCTKQLYWKVGGYNEDYVGCLGGGGPFLKRMKMLGGESKLLPDDVYLEVYTRDKIKDASVWDLSRDKIEFKERQKAIGTQKPTNPLRFKWREEKF